MKIDLVGGSYQLIGTSGSAQRTINMYPVLLQSAQGDEGRDRWALRRTPGLRSLGSTLGSGPIRGIFTNDQTLFCVSGSSLLELTYDAITDTVSYVTRGTVDASALPVRVARNLGNQFMIVDQYQSYIYNWQTATLTALSTSVSAGYNEAADVVYLDNYFVTFQANTATMQVSASNNGLSWDALDVSQTAGYPNNLVALGSIDRQLWAIGTKTTEVWYNKGNANFPLQPQPGLAFNIGCVSKYTVCTTDGFLIWLDPRGFVYQVSGESPQVISTEALSEEFINMDMTNTSAYVHAYAGHVFYVLTFQSESRTFVYDINSGYWHERQTKNLVSGGTYSHLGFCATNFAGQYFVGDYYSSNIYVYDQNVYTDNGIVIQSIRRTKFLNAEFNQLSVNELCVGMETGVGLQSGQGSDPQIMLRYSNTGGHTWSNESWRSMRKVGDYHPYVVWRRLGIGRDWMFEFAVSDPVQFWLFDAYIR